MAYAFEDTEHLIKDEAGLRTVYNEASPGAVMKEMSQLEKHTRRFINLSTFMCIGTARPDGLADVSPRGGEAGFVSVLDDKTLALPDRPGNNRLDTLTNIVNDPTVGLLFFLPGINEMLRINGRARVSVDPALLKKFEHKGHPPLSVLLVEVREVYMHCAKAVARSKLWSQDVQIARKDFPTLGQIMRDQMKLDMDAKVIDDALDANTRDGLYKP